MTSKYSQHTEKTKIRLRNYQKLYRARHPEVIQKQKEAYRLAHPQKFKRTKSLARQKRFQPTVYIYFDPTGQPIYVGKSNYPNQRAKDHSKYSLWWNSDLLLITMTCKDEWESMEYEGRWGGRYKPVQNIDGQRRIKYKPYIDVEIEG